MIGSTPVIFMRSVFPAGAVGLCAIDSWAPANHRDPGARDSPGKTAAIGHREYLT
jgi:hypothetical protein